MKWLPWFIRRIIWKYRIRRPKLPILAYAEENKALFAGYVREHLEQIARRRS